jgi:hypothetical protein
MEIISQIAMHMLNMLFGTGAQRFSSDRVAADAANRYDVKCRNCGAVGKFEVN